MEEERQCRFYEREAILSITGETIRPGGLSLTQRIVRFCDFLPGMNVIDVGCGTGATVKYLREHHHLNAYGVDVSRSLISRGRRHHPRLPLVAGLGESLSLRDSSADGVLMECSLSVMGDASLVLPECHRILKENGWLAVTDLCFRRERPSSSGQPSETCHSPCAGRMKGMHHDAQGLQPDSNNAMNMHHQEQALSCLHGARFMDEIRDDIVRNGFRITLWEDHTECLRQLIVDIIWQHGSVQHFMSAASPAPCSGFDYKGLNPGYYLCIARKLSA